MTKKKNMAEFTTALRKASTGKWRGGEAEVYSQDGGEAKARRGKGGLLVRTGQTGSLRS